MAKSEFSFLSFFGPVLDALRALGASARPTEVFSWIEKNCAVPEAFLNQTNKNGGSKFENRVAWARFYLAKAGYIESDRHGVWALTEKGRAAKIDVADARKIVREQQARFGGDPKHTLEGEQDISTQNQNELVRDTEAPNDSGFLNQATIESELSDILLKMSDKGFEEFCARVLRQFGLENVIVIGRSGDDGIDGVGDLVVNKFVRTRVMFQCKRYSGSVPPKEIRDFRGAIQGRAERGIFLTTGSFSKNARQEGARENAVPIELVDRANLIDLIVESRLGVSERLALEISHGFFDQYF